MQEREFAFGASAVLLLICAIISARRLPAQIRQFGLRRARTQFSIGLVLVIIGDGISRALRWAAAHYPHTESVTSWLLHVQWIEIPAIAVSSAGVLVMIRAMTRDWCGERGWLSALLLTAALMALSTLA